jgi:antibiotic biosynthesis monooxygenase (ABM) superfamily enzyme
MTHPLNSGDQLTAVIHRRIDAGSEARFEALMQAFIGFVLKQPGHLGINIIRPAHGSRDYTVLDRFVSKEARRRFTSTPEYRDWKCPAFKRFLDIGFPMMPRPINPIFAIRSLQSCFD